MRLNLPSQVRAEREERNSAFPVRDRPRVPRRGASIRHEIQALSQRRWNYAEVIGSGCWSRYGKRSATVVFTP